MASVANDPNGTRRILFAAADKKRKTIRLGKVSKKAADSICRKVEALNTAVIIGEAPHDDVARWVAERDSKLYDKLAAVGLVKQRDCMTLGPFIEAYLDKRTDLADGTLVNMRRAKRKLVNYFGVMKSLGDVTEGDADEFRLWLTEHDEQRKGKIVKVTLAENTVRRICGRARQFFAAAMKRRLITSNPFGNMKGIAVRENKDRFYFVSRDETSQVLDACPDSQWRLLFALSRYGGLRCPSEHMELTWGDIDWARDRMTVRSPKTKRHEGKESRVVPIFPELRPHLREAFEEAPEGSTHVITRYRDPNANLRTQLQRILKRAGVKSWPKLFQNLRSTRETELAEEYPLHVVCDWIGNSAAVAAKHYLQVTDEHFEKAAQNPAQYDAVTPGKAQEPKSENPSFTDAYESVPDGTPPLAPTGLEPVLPA